MWPVSLDTLARAVAKSSHGQIFVFNDKGFNSMIKSDIIRI